MSSSAKDTVHKSVGEEHSNKYEQATIPNNQNPGPSSAAGSGDSKLVSGSDNNLPFPPKRQRQMKLLGAPSDDLKESYITKIDNALIKMITKDYQPLSVVEDEGFIEFTNLLQPKYKLPNRKKRSYELLPKIYSNEVLVLKSMLSDVDSVSVTTDIWTSDSNRSYITVTCHFIYQGMFLSKVLATEEIMGSHTGERISEVLKEIFCRWNILQNNRNSLGQWLEYQVCYQ
ncbi:hypothetical protein JTB14_020749 [Gonioctena quinquepunctata]|nr:hypothetical protein JTB14_020749 [Gonioctena quinquepunctata]